MGNLVVIQVVTWEEIPNKSQMKNSQESDAELSYNHVEYKVKTHMKSWDC